MVFNKKKAFLKEVRTGIYLMHEKCKRRMFYLAVTKGGQDNMTWEPWYLVPLSSSIMAFVWLVCFALITHRPVRHLLDFLLLSTNHWQSSNITLWSMQDWDRREYQRYRKWLGLKWLGIVVTYNEDVSTWRKDRAGDYDVCAAADAGAFVFMFIYILKFVKNEYSYESIPHIRPGHHCIIMLYIRCTIAL